jgi:hypothetical protein
MSIILSRLDLAEIFGDVDDFYQVWERFGTALPQLPQRVSEKGVEKLPRL